ncbi:MAG TPA: valine--tRNA ligase [Chitinophagaceae bacterium]|nr:valine--tRNA ligase [Chitinophagaceae bacterium]
MVLSAHFQPEDAEEKWYNHWKGNGYFRSIPDERPPYTIVIPPPNVTGVLHLGHTLNSTIQDILIRRARMTGYNACWVPGCDHASIATEARVVAMLKEKGIQKSSLTRDQFMQYAYEWKEKYGGIIYGQLEKLGCSCDWDRVDFTMDDHYYQAVIRVFVNLYNQGLIYRGARMIHWDPAARTALSDEEVEYREVHSVLYYIRYLIEDPPDPSAPFLTVATTRPETILGDTAIAINPLDHRYQHLKGAFVRVPLINRRIPVIQDSYVDPEFGTGCLKVTPAHDLNDYNLGLKHKLPLIDVLNEDGTMSEAAQLYVGEDRFIVREKIVLELREKGFLVREENILNKNGYSQRTQAVVEPRISTQWFFRMKELGGQALDAVMSGDIRMYPPDRFINTYKFWMENLEDWCLSRQLWWGQRIPAWYDDRGNVTVAENLEEATKKHHRDFPDLASDLRQDDDVLDTWFSSWLWPIEVFRGITQPAGGDLAYYYPTSVLVTGQDIIFFWVSRMIMAGYAFLQEKPFRDVYFTGMVRDRQGRKMSKSLGNSPDLQQLIGRYGADGVRFGIMIASPAGNDLLFDEESCTQGHHFCNKLWNALKLIRKWEEGMSESSHAAPVHSFALTWFGARIRESADHIGELFRQYRLSEALKILYGLIWDDFCSWYLEWIKPSQEQSLDGDTVRATIGYYEALLQLLHPFMPFITEELYHLLKPRPEGDDLMIRQLDMQKNEPDSRTLGLGDQVKKLITAIREIRNRYGIKFSQELGLTILTTDRTAYGEISGIVSRQVHCSPIQFTEQPVAGAIAFVVNKDSCFLQTGELPDIGEQKAQWLKDLAYHQGFLSIVENKLRNTRFLENARPAVVEAERKKKADAEEKIKVIEENLKHL